MSAVLQLATSMHRGNLGIKTGSTSRAAGKTHLLDPATSRTLCGRGLGSMTAHQLTYPLAELPVRLTMCPACMAHT